MIDSQARKHLLGLIDDYMDQTSILGVILDTPAISQQTGDDGVKKVAQWMNDIIQHTIFSSSLSRTEWMALNRFRLFLQSDCEMFINRQWKWTVRQTLALSVFLISVAIFYYLFQRSDLCAFGFGILFYVVDTSVAVALTYWYEMREENFRDEYYPLCSLKTILAIRRTVPEFRCKKSPMKAEKKTPRNLYYWFLLVGGFFYAFVSIVFLTPLMLLGLCLPELHQKTELRLPLHSGVDKIT